VSEKESEYAWLRIETVLALHEMSILRFGGSRGIRDRWLLESAITRPQNLLLYGEGVGISDLAADYMTGIIHNHPFVDGNKRAGLAAAGAFLERHGMYLQADQAELFALVISIDMGDMEETAVALWVAGKLVQVEPGS
jgi:death-on-curing protein